MIPKIIHFCWLSNDPYPLKIQRCINSWKKNLPDYQIILWDTKKFPLKNSIWVEEAYNAKKYAFAADYIRFYSLYHYGGIYLDSDVEVLKSFDSFLHLPYFMGAEKAGTIEAAILGAQKGQDWVKTCLDYYNNRHFILNNGEYDIRKLPEIMVEEIKKIKPICHLTLNQMSFLNKIDFEKQLIIFPDEFFSPKIFDSRKVILTANTYAIHHYQNSWFSTKAKLYYRIRSKFIHLFGYQLVRKLELFIFYKKFK